MPRTLYDQINGLIRRGKRVIVAIAILWSMVMVGIFVYKGFAYRDSGNSGVQFANDKYSSIFCCQLPKCQQDSRCIKDPSYDDPAKREAIIKDFFDTRLADYQEDRAKLSVFLKTLSVLVIFGWLLLYYDPQEVTLPFLSTAIPQKLVALVIVLAMAYFWVNFGLLMMSTIDSRMVLEFAVDHMEASLNSPINHYYSKSRVLLDQGFIDPWCTYYYDVFKSGFDQAKHHKQGMFFLFMIYAPLLGLVVGVAVTVALNLLVQRPNLLTLALLAIVCFIISASSAGMVGWYEHSAFFYAGVWLVAICFMIGWILRKNVPGVQS